MTKTFNLVSNLTNQAGLEQDYKLVRALLESAGHKVNGCQFNDYDSPNPPADITICLEVVNPRYFSKENWLVPNSEWWFPSFNGTLKHFSKLLCKTHDAVNIWTKKPGAPKDVRYIGWEARDLFLDGYSKHPSFLHAAGKSETKNTEAVLAAWRTGKIHQRLTVLSQSWRLAPLMRNMPENVTVIQRASDHELQLLMNTHLFHLMPSGYEGYGHSIHEALGCGGIVLTTNAPPMNEIGGIDPLCLIPAYKAEKRLEAKFYSIYPDEIVNTVANVNQIPADWIGPMVVRSRQSFLYDRTSFRKAFLELANA